MSFRDDHDATLARAEALARELRRTQDHLVATRVRLAKAEAARAKLAAQLREVRVEPVEPEPPPPKPTEPPVRPDRRVVGNSPIAMLGTTMLIVGLVIAAFAYGIRHEYRASDARDDDPPCVLDSMPSGARVYQAGNGDLGPIGRTPLSRSRAQWIRDDVAHIRYELRSPDYATRSVGAPLAGDRCHDTRYELR